jgi:SAM-dependent methyltransferase
MSDAYAAVPYPGHPYARTHPDHLALMARLHGLAPADPDACRVVELACGDGMNLVAMAAASAGVRVAGIDLDAAAIRRGQAVAGELGITDRVDLRTGDLLDDVPFEPADYAICHGLYTWAPPEVADAALAAMGRLLAPDGVGFLSFNLRPGWGVRRALGPALARHAAAGGVAAARELLAALEEPLAEREDAYGLLLADERRRLSATSDGLLFHDDLSPLTTAAWHGDVVRHADRHGLRVLRDAHPDTLRMGPQADQELADVVFGAPYREVVLVAAGSRAAAQPTAAGVATLLVGEDRRPVDDREEAERLLAGLGEGTVELHAAPARHASAAGERPLAFALARAQAARGADVTTLRHTRLTINDAAGRAILALCDGTRDRAALARDAAAALEDPGLEPRLGEVMDTALERLAANALFLDDRRTHP